MNEETRDVTVKLEDRPIEQVREETIDQLIVNYSHGVISAEAFERRLDQAMETDDHHEIVALVEDLPMEADTQYDRFKDKSFSTNYDAHGHDENERVVSILSSSERSGQWPVPKQIDVYMLLGSAELDFTDAVFHHQTVRVKIIGGLSSLEIFVPEDVNVVCKTLEVLSSTDNSTANVRQRQAPTLVIEGWSVLSSLEVSVKRTMKEKFMSFANSLKQSLVGDSDIKY